MALGGDRPGVESRVKSPCHLPACWPAAEERRGRAGRPPQAFTPEGEADLDEDGPELVPVLIEVVAPGWEFSHVRQLHSKPRCFSEG